MNDNTNNISNFDFFPEKKFNDNSSTDSNDIGKSIIEECVKAHNTHLDDLDKQQVLENLKKTIDEYTKLTYNTKLCNFDIDIPNTVDYLYDRWIKILKSEGRL